MHIQQNINLQSFNTLALPSQAEFLCVLQTLDDVHEIFQYLQRNKLAWQILGGGSNVLLPEQLPGYTLQMQLKGWQEIERDPHSVVLKVAAGESWHNWVALCIEHGFYGLENLALIPGTVGAAPIQNIGAYGVEVQHYIQSVGWYDFECQKTIELSAKECEFAYRDSVFKHRLSGRGVITHVVFRVPTQFTAKLEYPGLQDAVHALNAPVTAKAVFDAVCYLRKTKLPDPVRIPNCGSFFKNPVIPAKHFEALQQRFPKIPFYPIADQPEWVKIPAAWLIDTAGWKGKVHGGVRVHDQQALVVVNPDKQPLGVVLQFSQKIVESVKSLFAIELEREPQILGGDSFNLSPLTSHAE